MSFLETQADKNITAKRNFAAEFRSSLFKGSRGSGGGAPVEGDTMKYLKQTLILIAITFAAEIIKFLVPLPVPASIYGLVLLFALLKSGVLKLEQVETVGNLLLELMPLLLVSPSVSFLTAMDSIRPMLLPVLMMGFLGTMAVMAVTGRVAQWMIRREARRHG